MIQLPKTNTTPKETEALLKCHPVCKSRRRWKGQVQKVSPNSLCPPFSRKDCALTERHAIVTPEVVRICQADNDDTVKTPYLRYAEIAKKLGAWDAVNACCAFCKCGSCCSCGAREYVIDDADRSARRRPDMRSFDARVKTECQKMMIMYDKY